MKRCLAALLIYLPVLLTGCMQEDWSFCAPEDNCLLLYGYQENGVDAFTDNIRGVDLILFDENGRYVARYNSTEQELAEFRGIGLVLDPGDYYVVAWGNLEEDSDNPITSMTDGRVDMDKGEEGLPLFYAPYVRPTTRTTNNVDAEMSVYQVTVPEKGIVEKELYFTKAYRTINVFVKDYKDPVLGLDPDMQLEISHLAYSYDYMLRVESQRRNRQTTMQLKETPAGRIPGTRMNTPYQEIEEEIEIKVSTIIGNTSICPPINLKDFLISEGISLEPMTLHEINILIEFKDGDVSLSLTDWKDNEVSPLL